MLDSGQRAYTGIFSHIAPSPSSNATSSTPLPSSSSSPSTSLITNAPALALPTTLSHIEELHFTVFFDSVELYPLQPSESISPSFSFDALDESHVYPEKGHLKTERVREIWKRKLPRVGECLPMVIERAGSRLV